jgi:hypothetical protein
LASTNSLTPNQSIECFPDDNTPYDWIVAKSCTLGKLSTTNDNVIVKNGSTLTISTNFTLDIDFASKHLLVESGSKVIKNSAGKIF